MNSRPLHEIGIRKAAILIDCLNADSTRLLLRQVDHSVARQVFRLSRSLGEVTRDEKEQVLTEFLRRVEQQPELVSKASRQTHKALSSGSSPPQVETFSDAASNSPNHDEGKER